jgi:hypothetical protein
MRPKNRFERFQPLTVRAAARIIRLSEAGRIPRWEVEHYLRELVATDAFASRNSHGALRRLADWWASFGNTGASGPFRMRQLRRRPRVATPVG